MTVDLVCGMDIPETETRYHLNHNGETYHFCSAHCKKAFTNQPGIHIKQHKKGIVGRFLERLAKENIQTFGNTKPSCH